MGFLQALFGSSTDDKDFIDDITDEHEDEINEDVVGIVIHFTPYVTYIYISESDDFEVGTDTSCIGMYDKNEVYYEVSGTYTNISNVKRMHIESILEKLGVTTLGLTTIRISVQ